MHVCVCVSARARAANGRGPYNSVMITPSSRENLNCPSGRPSGSPESLLEKVQPSDCLFLRCDGYDETASGPFFTSCLVHVQGNDLLVCSCFFVLQLSRMFHTPLESCSLSGQSRYVFRGLRSETYNQPRAQGQRDSSGAPGNGAQVGRPRHGAFPATSTCV